MLLCASARNWAWVVVFTRGTVDIGCGSDPLTKDSWGTCMGEIYEWWVECSTLSLEALNSLHWVCSTFWQEPKLIGCDLIHSMGSGLDDIIGSQWQSDIIKHVAVLLTVLQCHVGVLAGVMIGQGGGDCLLHNTIVKQKHIVSHLMMSFYKIKSWRRSLEPCFYSFRPNLIGR